MYVEVSRSLSELSLTVITTTILTSNRGMPHGRKFILAELSVKIPYFITGEYVVSMKNIFLT